jgi:signal transduction histidine kinase
MGTRIRVSATASFVGERLDRSGITNVPATPPGPTPDEVRTERSIALIRIAVVATVGLVYLSSSGLRPTLRPFPVSVLVVAALYSVWSLLARPYESMQLHRFQAATELVDVGLITLWCVATGGAQSDYWELYLVAIIAVAMRFSLVETVAATAGLALLYVGVMSVRGGIPETVLYSRLPLLVLFGFTLGILARQRRMHQEQRERLATIAEERSHALREERALVAQLRQVDLAKSEFVAVVSHEFRTPLATIIGVLGTLRTHGDALEPSIREEVLAGAQTQAQRLARLVEDLLTVSRIEDGAMPLDVQSTPPERLIFQAVEATHTADRVRVELNGVEAVPCDPDQIVRVLTNLIDNARKYSPEEGQIYVVVSQDEGWVTFRVRDEGKGIPADRRDEVFERFRRLSERPGTPGVGLGLYITRWMVEAHGGTIRVDEAPGGGADFNFTLPRRIVDQTAPARLGTQPERPERPAAITSV